MRSEASDPTKRSAAMARPFPIPASWGVWRGPGGARARLAGRLEYYPALEVEVDRNLDPDGDRLVVRQRRLEHPPLHRVDGGLVEHRHRPDHLHVLHAAVFPDEHVEHDASLDLRLTRHLGICRLHLRHRRRPVLVVAELAFRRETVALDDERVLPRRAGPPRRETMGELLPVNDRLPGG